MALLLQEEPVFYDVYVNGHLIGGSGGVTFWNARANTRKILKFPSSLAPNGRLILVLHCFPQGAATGIYGPHLMPYVLAPPDRMQIILDAYTLTYLRANVTHYLCFGAIGCAAFVFLLLFSVHSRPRH